MKSVVEWIQLAVALIIMVVMTAITIVSSETAVIKPKSSPGFKKSDLQQYLILIPFVKDKVRTWINRLRRQISS